jgi:hypothetical protein
MSSASAKMADLPSKALERQLLPIRLVTLGPFGLDHDGPNGRAVVRTCVRVTASSVGARVCRSSIEDCVRQQCDEVCTWTNRSWYA